MKDIPISITTMTSTMIQSFRCGLSIRAECQMQCRNDQGSKNVVKPASGPGMGEEREKSGFFRELKTLSK